MNGWLAYLETARESHIRAYRALPDTWRRERQWRRREALRYAALIREMKGGPR